MYSTEYSTIRSLQSLIYEAHQSNREISMRSATTLLEFGAQNPQTVTHYLRHKPDSQDTCVSARKDKNEDLKLS